ncbi:SpoIID/LytB domain-containing protein [Desulfosporosinus metallidurans]|nr:SpoIID/LytB domain-containing protein [Desulfosporosinus metallidurans]
MLRIVYRFSFLCVALFIFVLSQAMPCQAKEIPVELVWKLGQAGWVEIEVEQGDYQLIVDKTTLEFPTGSTLQVGWGGWAPVLRINHGEFQVSGESSVLELKRINPGSLRVKTPEGQDVVYRGGLKLNWQDSHWRLINTVDSEDYLKGVVPIEMSNEWAKGGIEGLKAQAVAARTFLVKHTENGKTITDSPDIDQAYAGKNVEGEASGAVEATRGEILVDAQSRLPIEALYSSHSGGYTEDAKNVWGNPDIHNVSHPDPYSQGVGGAVNHWRFIVSAPLLGSTFGLGPVRNIELDKFPSGRVKSVRMDDGFGQSKTVTGRTFVKAFYPFGQPIRTAAFLGSFFEAQQIPPSQELLEKSSFAVFLETKGSQKEQGPLLSKILSSSVGTSAASQPFGVFLFEGRGWGHGVGMSQWGAYHMAQLGYNYKEILLFYYNNTRIQPAQG